MQSLLVYWIILPCNNILICIRIAPKMVDRNSEKKLLARLKTPNPLFEKWLAEWHLEEATQENQESVYSKVRFATLPLIVKSVQLNLC